MRDGISENLSNAAGCAELALSLVEPSENWIQAYLYNTKLEVNLCTMSAGVGVTKTGVLIIMWKY